jgi:iron complex transport system ATP-binding protein
LIARALAQDAPMLLFDEPTSNLDISHQTKIMDLISKIQMKKMGFLLLALHDLSLAARYCDKILMMKEGKICHSGKPSKVLTNSNILDIYGTEARILDHPVYHTPVVLPLSKSDLDTGDNSI